MLKNNVKCDKNIPVFFWLLLITFLQHFLPFQVPFYVELLPNVNVLTYPLVPADKSSLNCLCNTQNKIEVMHNTLTFL